MYHNKVECLIGWSREKESEELLSMFDKLHLVCGLIGSVTSWRIVPEEPLP